MTALFAYTFFVWVELIGFDNTKPDFGVDEYLDRMAMKPQAVSLLLDNDGLFLSHAKGLPADFAFPPNVAAYGGRPFNRERRRQTWTAFQLKGLVAELKRHNVEVFASFFAREQYPVSAERAKVVSGKLASFLSDYGFSGLHGSDGYAPPRYLLPECADADRPRIARETAAQYAENWRTIVAALKPHGLKCWINTCWTRDPFEALYRYGVDYRLLAKTGIDGFIVESSAAAQSIHGWDYEESSPIDRSTAMLMRLKACVPEMPLVLLHGINDGTEQWSALRHDPARTASEALALGSVFYGDAPRPRCWRSAACSTGRNVRSMACWPVLAMASRVKSGRRSRRPGSSRSRRRRVRSGRASCGAIARSTRSSTPAPCRATPRPTRFSTSLSTIVPG